MPSAIEALDGETAIDTKTGGVTVRVADELTLPAEAVMFVVPCTSPVAKPALLTPAIAGADELQLTVRFCTLPSL